MNIHVSRSRNLLPVLEMAEAVYRGSAGQLPLVGRQRLAERAEHLAAAVRFGMDEPEAMRRLRSISADLRTATSLDSLLPRVLDQVLSLTDAVLGTLQLRDPVSDSLWLVTQSGFGEEFLEYFAIVGNGISAYGRAAQAGVQTVIADVSTDAAFATHRGIAAAAGFRAVTSTLLTDYAGNLIGVVSAHFARPYIPPPRDLLTLALYCDAAGEAIARYLGVPGGDSRDDPAGPAVLAALLEPTRDQPPEPAVRPRKDDARDGRPAGQPAVAEHVMSQFVREVVNRLFSVGLSLESARSIIGEGQAADRVAAATDEVDRTIRDMRTVMFSLAANAGTNSPRQSPAAPGAQPGRAAELLDHVMDSILDIGVDLQAAADLPPGTARPHLTEALSRLDDLARAIRDDRFTREAHPGLSETSATRDHVPSARTSSPAALQQRLHEAARSLQTAAADNAALLEERATLTRPPTAIDYPSEIKRWRAFADQAGQLAERWERPDQP